MRARSRQFVQNLLLSLASLLCCLAVLEFVVFRFVLVPDDLLPNVSVNGVVRYQPGTQATFRHPDGRRTEVNINAEGWNSTKPAYSLERKPGVKRIAVIGDSYVHGAFVATAEGFPEVMEAALRKDGVEAEVYRFGMDGAPLSQYLHMLRREVRAYRPDVVVVPLIHNDFDESWRFLKTRYASAFMKIGRDDTGKAVEIEPAPFRGGAADLLRHSAMFRYLYYETNAYLHLKGLISRYFWGGNEEWSAEFISSAVDTRKIADHDSNRFAARYVLAEMKRIAEEDGFKLAFVMDGVREAIYEGRARETYAVAKLNDLATYLTAEADLPFLDLQDVFADDFAVAGQRFEYPYDWHWNRRANRLVGEAIANMLTSDPELLGPVRQKAAGRVGDSVD
jgi:hypothetical protein